MTDTKNSCCNTRSRKLLKYDSSFHLFFPCEMHNSWCCSKSVSGEVATVSYFKDYFWRSYVLISVLCQPYSYHRGILSTHLICIFHNIFFLNVERTSIFKIDHWMSFISVSMLFSSVSSLQNKTLTHLKYDDLLNSDSFCFVRLTLCFAICARLATY